MGNMRRAILVTGGGQGIGKAMVQRFLTQGHVVVMADIDEEAGYASLEELQRLGNLHYVAADVARECDVKRLVEKALQHGGRIDALVNNAATSRRKPLAELSLDEWNRVLGVNLTGPMLCAKHAAPHLGAVGGAIVNIASTRAVMSEPNTEAYSASKGGLVALTHALAISLGPEVRVNCVCPGWIEVGDWKKPSARVVPRHSEADRAQHPVGRVGVPGDVGALVDFLISEEAGFITGANFVVDGGMTRKMIYAD